MTESLEKIGPALRAAVLKLHELGETDQWAAFAFVTREGSQQQRGYNAFRYLQRRGWIEDAAAPARKAYAAAMTPTSTPTPHVAHPRRWRLTPAGQAVADWLLEVRH